MKLRVGSRESVLAVWQAEAVMGAIRAWDASIELELVTMKTTGDKILDRTLDKVGGKGLFVKDGPRVARDRHGMGRFILAHPQESATEREIALTEVDIDNFIRAKGAIFSAIETLLSAVDMTVECIDKVYVAGGIGSGINMKNAVNIGMFPDVPLEKFQYIGNSSLTGAYAMVLSDQAAEKVDEVAKNMTYMELSTHPGYMDSFVAACFLPHTNRQLFPHSVQEV